MNDISPYEIQSRRDDEFLRSEIARKTQTIEADGCKPAIVQMSAETYSRANRLELIRGSPYSVVGHLGEASIHICDGFPPNEVLFIRMKRPGCNDILNVPLEKQ